MEEHTALEQFTAALEILSGWAWGPPMLLLIGGTGLYLTLRLAFLPLRRLGFGLRQLIRGSDGEGTIGSRSALAATLAATVGTGNIAGVATAIHWGGPGALVWMWLIALVGMATKYSEAVLAVKFRRQDSRGQYIGGPMYYIRDGLGPRFAWLAVLFAVFGTVAGFGIGNTVQANSVADGFNNSFGINPALTGMVLAVLVGLVILGGIRRIANIAAALVPLMAALYLALGAVVLLMHAPQLPAAVILCLQSAFTGTAATGGFAGATVWAAISYGVARGIFSNEAGLGSSPIAHASATTDHPVRQGSVAMLGTFIDTLIICSITGLAIVVTGAWESGATGAPLSALAFSASFGELGQMVVALALGVFAFTTLLGWSLYGERCAQYLFGDRAVVPFRLLWVAAVPAGALLSLDIVWGIADILNALMAIPNLIALLLLSPVILKLTHEFFRNEPH